MKKRKSQNQITQKYFSVFFIFLLLLSNILPTFEVVLAEGEDAPVEVQTTGDVQPAEEVVSTPVEETVTPVENTGDTNTVTDTSTTTESVGEEESIPTDGSTTTIETVTDATSSPIVGFDTTSTTTLGTTTFATSTAETFVPVVESVATDTVATDSVVGDLSTTTLPTGTTTIETGDTAATANLLNIVNTNSINSTGTIQMTNLPGGYNGDLDFRIGSTNNSPCNLADCGGVENISAKIQNDASIDNVLALQAGSGGNSIATAGGGVIDTGNASVGLNLVNVANTNFINSNYFLLALNSFKDVNGDIVLPSLAEFLKAVVGYGENTNIVSNQSADINNDLKLDALTGDNVSKNSLTSLTETGDANTFTNVYNNVNSNLFGGKTISILLRVTGNWLGKIIGLPEGMDFTKDGDLYTLQIDDGVVSAITPAELEILSTTTAKINNKVDMLANTGDNQTQDTLNSIIKTGDAVAAANVVNIANTNVVGKNWMLAIINIFGDFNGNISFGRPDIKVGQVINTDGPVQNGGLLRHKIFVENTGDVDGDLVKVTAHYDKERLDLLESASNYVGTSEGDIAFNLGTLKPGEKREIDFTTRVKNTGAGDQIQNTVIADLLQKDNNPSNNLNTQIVTGYNLTLPRAPDSGTLPRAPENVSENFQLNQNNFVVVREVPYVLIPDTKTKVHQKVTLRNMSNKKIEGAVFRDIMTDLEGNEVQRENWDLGTIGANEDIELEYDMSFGGLGNSGEYIFASELSYKPDQNLFWKNNGKVELQIPEPVKTNLIKEVKTPKTTNKVIRKIETKFEPLTSTDTAFLFIPSTGTIAYNYQNTEVKREDVYSKIISLFSNIFGRFLAQRN